MLWPLEGQNLANEAQKRINSEPTKFELDFMNTFSDNGQKPPFSVILWLQVGQNLANVAQQNSEHSPQKCIYTPSLNWIA